MLSPLLVLLFAIFGASQALPGVGMRKTAESSAGTYGVDLSSYFSESDFECLKDEGFNFAIVRAFQSTGKPRGLQRVLW